VAPLENPYAQKIRLTKMCAYIVTNLRQGGRIRFRFPGKNGIVQQSLHGSINEKTQFINNKITIWFA
jgi:hypothetical protein